MRKLIWHTNLGHVNLSLTFDNGEFEFKCLPIHAILIGYFDDSRIIILVWCVFEFILKRI